MEHQEAELHDGMSFGTADTAAGRFLRDLRQLRDIAGLGPAELAARAHYPRNVIDEAECGPSLPELPVLSAYVRGCGGSGDDVAEWEERWRRVTGAKASPLLPARDAGNSDAASAGARIGATSAAADSHDPAAIMAALDRFAERMATGPGSSPAGYSGYPGPSPEAPGAPRLSGTVPEMRPPSVPSPDSPPSGSPAGPESAYSSPFSGPSGPASALGAAAAYPREPSTSEASGARLSPVPAQPGSARRRLPGGAVLAVGAAAVLCVLVLLLILFA